jgi:hypothetical protein
MGSLVFVSRATATAFAAGVDADLGLPLNGVRMGSGTHVSIAQGRTVRYAPPRKHRTLTLWAYPEDPIVATIETRVAVPGSATRRTLDATWRDATDDDRGPDPEI